MEENSDEYKKKFCMLYTAWKDDEVRTPASVNLMNKIFDGIGFVSIIHEAALHNKITKLKGWCIDGKLLTYMAISDKTWEIMKAVTPIASNFEEVETYCESIKHRFASKKFGI